MSLYISVFHGVGHESLLCVSRVGIRVCSGAGQCVIPAFSGDLLVSVLSSFLLLLHQLLVLPRHVLLPETPSVPTSMQNDTLLLEI